jgi:hypothetical protein
MQERYKRDEWVEGLAVWKPAGEPRVPRDLDLHRQFVLRLGGLPLGPDREELDDSVIPHAELWRIGPGPVSLVQVGRLRGVQDEVRSGGGQADEGEVMAWRPLHPVHPSPRSGELPVDPAAPYPSHHSPLLCVGDLEEETGSTPLWWSPLIALVQYGSNSQYSVSAGRHGDVAQSVEHLLCN